MSTRTAVNVSATEPFPERGKCVQGVAGGTLRRSAEVPSLSKPPARADVPELRKLVASVVQAGEQQDPDAEQPARNALVAWCEHEPIPHAVAEEGPLYAGPKKSGEGRLLVEGMLAEHQVIVGLVERLRVTQGVKAAVAGGAIEEVFALHLDKENRPSCGEDLYTLEPWLA